MSADNGIVVKKIGRYWYVREVSYSVVWSREYLTDIEQAKRFASKAKALLYAHDLHQEIPIVEYGVMCI